MIYSNNDIYNGEWKNDKRNGKGQLIKNIQVKIDGYWIDDQFI